MADYPSSIKSFTNLGQGTKMDDTGLEGDTVINALQDEVAAMQSELGTNPKTITAATTPAASPSNIAEFLDMVATHLKAITGGANWYTAVGTSLASIVSTVTSHIANVSNPHSVTKTQVGLGNVTDVEQMPLSYLDTDDTLAADSDVKVPSQQAVKAYVDNNSSSFATLYAPQGFLINGKLSVTVASNNITVAIKTLAGTDPAAGDPVYCRIGDNIRTLTSALSVTKNAGTNWFNSGSSELATKEIDYFAYLGYNATDGVVIGFARIPFAQRYNDFSTTTTDEKYCAISTITTAAANDYYENIGRFAATLSATASFNWSVPTFTGTNLINKPTDITRLLSWTPTWAGFSSSPTGVNATYKVSGNQVFIYLSATGDGTSNATSLTITAPFKHYNTAISYFSGGESRDNTAAVTTAPSVFMDSTDNVIDAFKDQVRGNWTSSGGKRIFAFWGAIPLA